MRAANVRECEEVKSAQGTKCLDGKWLNHSSCSHYVSPLRPRNAYCYAAFPFTILKELMTDETQPDSKTENEKNTVPFISKSDWFLQKLVQFANDYGFEFGVTLQVGGMLVTGTVISGAKYFDEFSDSFTGGLDERLELNETFQKLFTSYKSIYDVPPEESANVPPPEYVHIRNARFFQPGQRGMPEANKGVLWRGRLREVGGFNLGSFSEG